MPSQAPHELLPIAQDVVGQAVDYLVRHRPTEVRGKGDLDMVTDLDVAVEKLVRAQLQERTPEVGFLGEETGPSQLSQMYWALDPIDGTANFIHGLPICAVSLGLIANDQPVLGVIAMPFLGQRYWAVEGRGAFCDGERITVSTTTELNEAMVAVSGYGKGATRAIRNEVTHAIDRELAANVQRVRKIGSVAIELCWLAEGRFDASVTLDNATWDTGAGAIIAREAGAAVADIDGSPHSTKSRNIIAANPNLLDKLLPLLRVAEGTPYWPNRP